MGLVEVRRIAAVGILGFGVHGAQIAPPLSKDISSGGEKQYVAQGITYRAIDFSNWPRREDEEGCYAHYPDPEAGEYQVFIGCPNYSVGTLIPGAFRDFVLDIGMRNVNGSNVWYGPVIVKDWQTIRESQHQLLVSDEGMFRYQQIDYSSNVTKTPTVRTLQPLPPESRTHTDNVREFRITRRGGRIEVISNGVALYEDQILLDNQVVNIGFAVVTPRALTGEAHVSIQTINVHFPTERRTTNLAILPSFDLPALQIRFAASLQI